MVKSTHAFWDSYSRTVPIQQTLHCLADLRDATKARATIQDTEIRVVD